MSAGHATLAPFPAAPPLAPPAPPAPLPPVAPDAPALEVPPRPLTAPPPALPPSPPLLVNPARPESSWPAVPVLRVSEPPHALNAIMHGRRIADSHRRGDIGPVDLLVAGPQCATSPAKSKDGAINAFATFPGKHDVSGRGPSA